MKYRIYIDVDTFQEACHVQAAASMAADADFKMIQVSEQVPPKHPHERIKTCERCGARMVKTCETCQTCLRCHHEIKCRSEFRR